jgi:hypothetical protein
MSNPEYCVYAIRAIGTSKIKIGTTSNLSVRLATIQQCTPFPLEIAASWPGDERLEKLLHEELADYRLYGEWFEIDLRVVESEVCRLMEITQEPEMLKPRQFQKLTGQSAFTPKPPNLPGIIWYRNNAGWNYFAHMAGKRGDCLGYLGKREWVKLQKEYQGSALRAALLKRIATKTKSETESTTSCVVQCSTVPRGFIPEFLPSAHTRDCG